MQASDDKSWKRFIDKAMQEARPDETSKDFTEHVLAALEAQKDATFATRYKAPISRPTWVVLALVFAGLILWTSISGTSTQWEWTAKLSSYIDVTGLFNEVTMPVLGYSSLYSIGFFALFVLLQLVLMKRFFDRRLGLE